jgi:hypothetical protein
MMMRRTILSPFSVTQIRAREVGPKQERKNEERKEKNFEIERKIIGGLDLHRTNPPPPYD